MIFCKDCIYLRREYNSSKYALLDKPDKPIGYGTIGNYMFCQHPDCFEVREDTQPDRIHRYVVRVAGQAQFNRDNDCARFVRAGFLRKLLRKETRLCILI